ETMNLKERQMQRKKENRVRMNRVRVKEKEKLLGSHEKNKERKLGKREEGRARKGKRDGMRGVGRPCALSRVAPPGCSYIHPDFIYPPCILLYTRCQTAVDLIRLCILARHPPLTNPFHCNMYVAPASTPTLLAEDNSRKREREISEQYTLSTSSFCSNILYIRHIAVLEIFIYSMYTRKLAVAIESKILQPRRLAHIYSTSYNIGGKRKVEISGLLDLQSSTIVPLRSFAAAPNSTTEFGLLLNFIMSTILAHRFHGERSRIGNYQSSLWVPLSFLSDEIKSRITERNKHADIIIRIRDADKVAPLSFKVPRCLRR
ncbi:hypothetical protein ALC60_06536, partial [Trachymyrmex zeteki]